MTIKHIIPAFFCIASLSVAAQTLDKEIIMQREIKPELQAATRLNNRPTVLAPDIKPSNLTFSDMTAASQVTGMLTKLEPAQSDPAVALSNYRGYASIGYFPTFNLGSSIGYRIIDKPLTSLGAWMQYNGLSYKWNPMVGENLYDSKLERNSVTIGVDFARIFPHAGRLDVGADFSYNSLNRPWEASDSTYRATAFNLDASWSARKHDMMYTIGVNWNLFSLNNKEHTIATAPNLAKGLSQNVFTVKAGTAYFLSGKSSLVGAVSADFVRYNHYNTLIDESTPNAALPYAPYVLAGSSKTLGLISLRPSYRYNSDNFSTKIGVNAQISTNSGKTFHIAPDVSVNYAPLSCLDISATAGGGEQINRLQTLFAINPYMSPSMAYDFSHQPIVFNANVKIGPFRGACIELFGGFSAANDWLMPLSFNGEVTDNFVPLQLATFSPVNLTAWTYGAKLSYRHSRYFEGSVKFTGAPGSYGHAYYLNYDRATSVLDVNLTSNPIDNLTVNVGFELRSDRSQYATTSIPGTLAKINLDDASNLKVGAAYSFFDWLSVYARVENLLGNKADDIWLARRQGVHGLVGLNVKF